MDISRKILVLTILIFVALTAVFTFIHTVQLSNFLDLEGEDTSGNVERVQNSIFSEQKYLDYLARDWACWNDTYMFVDDGNQEFIDANLLNETFEGLKIDVMIFVNNSGSVVYAKSIDSVTGRDIQVPKDLLELLSHHVVRSGGLLPSKKALNRYGKVEGSLSIVLFGAFCFTFFVLPSGV